MIKSITAQPSRNTLLGEQRDSQQSKMAHHPWQDMTCHLKCQREVRASDMETRTSSNKLKDLHVSYFFIFHNSLTLSCIVNPSPDRYNIKSFVQTITDKNENESKTSVFGTKRKTFCFGAGREDFNKTCVNTKCLGADKIVPGPGQYADKTRDTGVNGRKFSL